MDPESRVRSSSDDWYRSRRKETIRNDLTRRLRGVCAQFSEEEFQHLIDKMTERQLRSERAKNY